MLKNISAKKKVGVFAVTVYSVLNLGIILRVVFSDYWWAIFAEGSDLVFLGVVVGLFLNAALIVYFVHSSED